MHVLKSKFFVIECAQKMLTLPNGILMTFIKHVVFEKREFEYRDETLLVALLGIFGLSCF